MPICGTSGSTVLIPPPIPGEEDGQPVREVQGVTQPLNTVNKDRDRAGVENRLQRAADVDGQQEHQVHNKEKIGNPRKRLRITLSIAAVKRLGSAVRVLLTASQMAAMV